MITSADNKQIKEVIKLNTNSRARRKAGLFVVEGRKMFMEAPMDRIDHIYVQRTFYEGEGREELLNKDSSLTEDSALVEIVDDKVFKLMSDTLTPQGILTLVKAKDYSLDDLFASGKKPLIMVLESLQDPGNFGTILRTGEGAGVTGIIVNNTTVDRFNPKTIRSTMGSVYRMPVYETDDIPKTLDELKKRGVKTYAAHLKGENEFYQEDYREATAFLIGNEGKGLSDEVSDAADILIRIPMEGEVESLNAGVAASLLMYESLRQRRL